MNYRVKDEFVDSWTSEDVSPLIVTGEEIKRLAREWDVSVEELMDEVEEAGVYVIKTWYQPKTAYTPAKTDYFDRETLEEAKECAEFWAKQFEAFGLDYSVKIFCEITNY